MRLEIEIDDKQVEFLKQFVLNQCEGAKDNLEIKGDFEPFWDLLMSIGKQLNELQEMTDSKELQVPSFSQAEIIKSEQTEDFLEWLKRTEQRNEFERSEYNAK